MRLSSDAESSSVTKSTSASSTAQINTWLAFVDELSERLKANGRQEEKSQDSRDTSNEK